MLSEVITVDLLRKQLTSQDDPNAWKTILAVLCEEFIARYRDVGGAKEAWFLRIGVCSHWIRPHNRRWNAAGGFAWPVGYDSLPELDWSVPFCFDGRCWNRVDKLSGKKQVVFRVAVPSRTARHKQAAVHSVWSPSGEWTLYGFRNVKDKWVCVAASDERERGRLTGVEKQISQG